MKKTAILSLLITLITCIPLDCSNTNDYSYSDENSPNLQDAIYSSEQYKIGVEIGSKLGQDREAVKKMQLFMLNYTPPTDNEGFIRSHINLAQIFYNSDKLTFREKLLAVITLDNVIRCIKVGCEEIISKEGQEKKEMEDISSYATGFYLGLIEGIEKDQANQPS